MKKETLALSVAIRRVRFPLTVLVVMIHSNIVAGILFLGVEYSVNSILAKSIISLFSLTIGQLAVPVFFIVSGYLFASKITGKADYMNALLKRSKTVLLPYIVWNSLAMIIIMLPRMSFLSAIFPNISNEPFTIGTALKGYWVNTYGMDIDKITVFSPWDMPLWYIRDLLVMFVVTPLLFFIHKHTKILGLALIFSIYIIMPSSIDVAGISMTSLLFYSIGIYVFKEDWGRIFQKIDKKCFVLALALFVFFTIANHIYSNGYFNNLFKVFGSLMILYMFSYRSKEKECNPQAMSFLTGSSFFIYASHTIFNGYVTKLLIVIMRLPIDMSLVQSLTLYLISVMITVFIALVTYGIVRRSRMMTLVLTGGR